MTMKIGEVIEKVPCIDEFVKNKEVDVLFTSNPSLRSVVVVRDEKPIGHITRTHFYQKIGTPFINGTSKSADDKEKSFNR